MARVRSSEYELVSGDFTDPLSIDALYRMITDVSGMSMEFGAHRGRQVAVLTTLRGVHKP